MFTSPINAFISVHRPLKVNHAPSETRSLTRSPREETMPGLEDDINHSSSKRLRRRGETVLHVRILGYRCDDESAGEPCKWRKSQCISRPEQQGRHCRMLRFGKKKKRAADLRAAHGVIRIMIFLFDDHTGETVEGGGQGGKLPIYLSACAVRNTNRAPAGKTSTSSCLQDGAIMSHLSPSCAAPASDTCTARGG